MLKEFKKFAIRGNVIDMAIGVVVGAAFGKIVTSFVDDLLMPFFGFILGGIKLDHLKFTLRAATETAGAITINYGIFIQTIIDFLIIAFSIFIVIRQFNKIRHQDNIKEKAENKKKQPSEDILLLREIRDSLKK